MTPALSGLTGIVLAAGLSRRAAPHNKLLLPFRDSTVVRCTVEAMVGAGLGELLVVTGHQRDAVERALAGLPIRFVFADDFSGGMGHSLATGVRHSSPDTTAWVVTPGDLPRLSSALVRKIAAHASGDCHVIPAANGERGHPVLIGGWLRSQLLGLRGDEGARGILASPSEAKRCQVFDVQDTAILRDVDSTDSLSMRDGK